MQTSDISPLAGHFQNISNLARFIDASQDATETYLHLTRGVCEHSLWDISSIQVLDLKAGLAIPIIRHDPFNDSNLNGFPGWNASTSPVGRVLEDGKPLILQDAAEQAEFPGFRDDARNRGYHTTVIIPLEVRDSARRPMVYTVASRVIVKLDEADVSFLQCVAELSTIAIRKMRKLTQEEHQAQRMREILENMTTSLTKTLDSEAAGSLATGLSGLFPAGWLAVDLTSGRGLFDPEVPPPIPLLSTRRVPEDLISAAISSRGCASGIAMNLKVDGSNVRAEVSALQIDGSHVGALFFFRNAVLNDNERIAAQAGRLALSSFILRNFVEFKSRRVTARRLFTTLFDGEWRDLESIQDEAHRLDFDLSVPSRILMLRISDEPEVDDGTHSFILRSAQSVFGPAISCLLDGALVLLLSDRDERIVQLQDQFLSRVRPFLAEATILVMSDLIMDVEQLPKMRETCVNTIDVAQSMNAVGWVTATNIGEFSTLMASADLGKISAFLSSVLPEGLEGQDRKALVAVETIESFLQTGRRYQETADTLGIHVSTLRYRLEQLTDQYDLDFADSDNCFKLDLAIRLRKFKNSYDT